MMDGQECLAISVSTRGFLSERGVRNVQGEFRVNVLRADGISLQIEAMTLPDLAQLVHALNPPSIATMVAQGEDAAGLVGCTHASIT